MNGLVLVVDDDRAMCDLIEDDLSRRGLEVRSFTSPEKALSALPTADAGAMVTDLSMPQMDGIELCRRVVSQRPELPVIVLTAFGSLERAIDAIRAGAFDFVTKPVEMDLLAIAVERALRHSDLQKRVRLLSDEVLRIQPVGELLGESRPMQKLFDQIARVADSEATILISGESGTGKELVARELHRRSRRSSRPMVSINCAALPENLLESELFGHTRGAFTGATAERKGLFLEADGGSLYLDEIGSLPLSLQPKLLRALEEGRARPLGSDRELTFDARLIVATNEDLEKLVSQGRFRRDLYYRINVIELEVPPLRDRENDILLLAQHFISRFAEASGKSVTGLSEAAAQRLLAYRWPGNVRELRNSIERAVALTRLDRLAVADLPQKLRGRASAASTLPRGGDDAILPLAEVERRYILQALETLGGNKTLAARALGCDRKTLYRKLRAYEDETG